MTATEFPIRVVALYRFTPLTACMALRDTLAQVCRAVGVLGTLLLAPEGINGTIAGRDDAVDRVLGHIRLMPGCDTLAIRESRAEAMPFHRLKVRVKREIVTMGQPGIDPLADAGRYVEPGDWNALIDAPGTVLVDTRNAFEVAVGSFAGAVDPGTRSFRDFPGWFDAHRDELLAGGQPKRVAMFCTGGIRCEKATAYLRTQGVDEVYHLRGGILAYLEQVPPAESRWRGECFVFDQRVAVGHALAPGTHAVCHGCRMPVSREDRASPLFREGVACARCHDARTERQQAGYAERDRQTRLARGRGVLHVGATHASMEARRR